MKASYWVVVTIVVLIVGFLAGYGVWGLKAARLPEAEQALGSAQSQLADLKKRLSDLESNLGKVMNEKLNLEKQNDELKEALAKATKRRR